MIVQSFGNYAGIVRMALLNAKGPGHGGRELGALMAALCPIGLCPNGLIVPVPSRSSASMELAIGLSAVTGNQVESMLVRRHWGRKMRGLNQAGRKQSNMGLLAAPEVYGKRIILVDDVVTTGTTLNACQEAIERAGGIVCAKLTFCKA